jgi:hypothetical protein
VLGKMAVNITVNFPLLLIRVYYQLAHRFSILSLFAETMCRIT